MTSLILRSLGAICLTLGGALTAIGAALGVVLLCAYLEWDAAFNSAPLVLMLSAIIAGPGVVVCMLGAWLWDRQFWRMGAGASGVWLIAVGAALTLSPVCNQLWAMLRGSAFTAPNGPLAPYLVSMICGVGMVWLGLKLVRVQLSPPSPAPQLPETATT